MTWRAVLRLARPLFLVGGAVFYGLGATVAWLGGAAVERGALLWGLAVVWASQLATHFSNEYYDRDVDSLQAARPRWSGGSGVLPEGLLPPQVALRAARLALAGAIVSGTVVVLLIRPERLTAVLLGTAIASAWYYSSPPIRLVGSGLGEVGGAALLAALTPLVGYHLQGGAAPGTLAAACLPLVSLQAAMLLTVSVPDEPSDRAGGKRTLAVRIGQGAAGRLAAGATLAAFAVLPVLWAVGVSPALLAAVGMWTPVAWWHARQLWDGAAADPLRWDRAAFWGIGLVMGAAGSATGMLGAIALSGR